jgi:hypothetical protein
MADVDNVVVVRFPEPSKVTEELSERIGRLKQRLHIS